MCEACGAEVDPSCSTQPAEPVEAQPAVLFHAYCFPPKIQFCSEDCLRRFLDAPERYELAGDQR